MRHAGCHAPRDTQRHSAPHAANLRELSRNVRMATNDAPKGYNGALPCSAAAWAFPFPGGGAAPPFHVSALVFERRAQGRCHCVRRAAICDRTDVKVLR